MKKVILELPPETLRRLDELVAERVVHEKPMSRTQWLMQTKEGRAFWAKQSQKTHLSQEAMDKEISAAWREATGGIKVGRPAIMHHRSAIIIDLLRRVPATKEALKVVSR